MTILLVNTFDFEGAAKACIRLHEGLLLKKIASKILLKTKVDTFASSYLFQPTVADLPITFTEKTKNKVYRIALELKLVNPKKSTNKYQKEFLAKRPAGLEYYSYPTSTFDITKSALYQEADIIHRSK